LPAVEPAEDGIGCQLRATRDAGEPDAPAGRAAGGDAGYVGGVLALVQRTHDARARPLLLLEPVRTEDEGARGEACLVHDLVAQEVVGRLDARVDDCDHGASAVEAASPGAVGLQERAALG